eukprot:1427411-Rhodomonas_salina.2
MELAPEWQSDDLYEGDNARFPRKTITMVAREWKSHKGVRDRRNTSTLEHFVECEVISPLHFRQQGQYIIMPVSEHVRNACSKWNLQRMFKEHYSDPVTLADLS